MKILFSAEDFYPTIGGAEVFTQELINALPKKFESYMIFVGKKKEGRTIEMLGYSALDLKDHIEKSPT